MLRTWHQQIKWYADATAQIHMSHVISHLVSLAFCTGDRIWNIWTYKQEWSPSFWTYPFLVKLCLNELPSSARGWSASAAQPARGPALMHLLAGLGTVIIRKLEGKNMALTPSPKHWEYSQPINGNVLFFKWVSTHVWQVLWWFSHASCNCYHAYIVKHSGYSGAPCRTPGFLWNRSKQ